MSSCVGLETNLIDKKMDLQKQFKEETKQDAYHLNQTMWNDYYIEWLESKIEQLLIQRVVGQSEQLKVLLLKVMKDFDNGEVTWEKRDEIEEVVKTL